MKSVERAARALCEADRNPPGATMNGKPLWMDYLPEVGLVLAEIREPSEAILSTGEQVAGVPIDLEWKRMIDALMLE